MRRMGPKRIDSVRAETQQARNCEAVRVIRQELAALRARQYDHSFPESIPVMGPSRTPNISINSLLSQTVPIVACDQPTNSSHGSLSDTELPHESLDTKTCYSSSDLKRMDENYEFVIPTQDRLNKIELSAIQSMASASDEMVPCCICELCYTHEQISKHRVDDDLVKKMQLYFKPISTVFIPEFIRLQYDASAIDKRLKGIMLYSLAIHKEGDVINAQICSTCREELRNSGPRLSIANGNYTGHLPRRFMGLTRTDEQAVALVLPCVSLSVVTGGPCKTIKSHHYVVRNTEGPIVEMLPRYLASRVRVTMVGSMTPTQVAACKRRYELDAPLSRAFLQFLDSENREYRLREHPDPTVCRSNGIGNATIRTSVVIDKTTLPDGDDFVASMRDDSTYSNFGSFVQESCDDNYVEHEWVGAASLVTTGHQLDNVADILVRKSNCYESMNNWEVCVKMFPTLFPGGCGGPCEPRFKPISVRQWILRCFRVHDHRFEKHHAFMLLAFDHLASEEARRTLYFKMNLKKQALNVEKLSRSTLREAVKYFNYLSVCRAKGIKARPPSIEVQRVIDLRKGLRVPESAFYGSNVGRMRARHELFGMLKRFGPLQIFFTISPDTAGTYNIAVKAGVISKKAIEDANILLMPNRTERKSIGASYPVECAKYFLRVIDTVIEVILGWDQKNHAPKCGGGIFGVVRAFGAAAETQRAGDLHAHFAVWLHGFPSTSSELHLAIADSNDFRENLISLVDTVLETKPPCLREEIECVCCHETGSLTPLIPGIDAFRRPAPGAVASPIATCNVCGAVFRDKDIIDASLDEIAKQQNVPMNTQMNDFEKCRPPIVHLRSTITTSLLVRDIQTHYWNHCSTCFKKTIRTPQGSICRFLKPEVTHLGPTCIELGEKLRLHRPIGCEYVNPYNRVVMNSMKCNHDAQFVLSFGSKDTAAYVVKYCFKNQNPVENPAALALAAFAKAVKNSHTLPEDTSGMERGYRILGSMLYTITNGQEVAAPMAALYILHQTPFWLSHEFVHVILHNVVQQPEDSIEFSFSQSIFVSGDSSESNRISQHDLALGFDPVFFSKLSKRKVFVCAGDDIPDITSDLDESSTRYYYTALLTLFKPHRQSTLVPIPSSVLGAYRDFLLSGDIVRVERLKCFEVQMKDYYRGQRSSGKTEVSAEAELLRTRAPPTSTWAHESDDVIHSDNEMMDEAVPDDFFDADAVITPDRSTTKLIENGEKLISAVPNLANALKETGNSYPISQRLSVRIDLNKRSYGSLVVEPGSDADLSKCEGTQRFVAHFKDTETRLERLDELFTTVPYKRRSGQPRWTPTSLPVFPKIAEVSEAFTLNFWQHVAFETAARHLLYAYFDDISDLIPESTFPHRDPYEIKPQLIGYLGGEAGTGKSTVVDALLAFAKLWGREGTVETLAFTGVAAINIKGRTMHRARNLRLNGAEPKTAPSMEMKTRFAQVVLVIIDEISITNQSILGGTDSVSRSMSTRPGSIMGGRHILLIGDLLQLPPVGGSPCFAAPPCNAHRLRHTGYIVYKAINFVVFLTENMRARYDAYYIQLLNDLRWGRLSEDQLNALNSRVQSTIPHHDSSLSTQDSFYRPVVVCTNNLRCAINDHMIFNVAKSRRLEVFECIAVPSARSRTIVEHLINSNDDVTERVPMKLLFYIGMPVMVTRKHPHLMKAGVIANGVLGTIVGVYPPIEDLNTVSYDIGGIVIHKFTQRPELILLKLRGIDRKLVEGFPDGVIGLPPLHGSLRLTKMPNLSQTSITVTQFAIVPSFACTTEKLQGQTCHDGIVVTPLDRRKAVPAATLYVALTRATSLKGITFTDNITRVYLDKFKPGEAPVAEMLRLIKMIVLPRYTTSAEATRFAEWKANQHV